MKLLSNAALMLAAIFSLKHLWLRFYPYWEKNIREAYDLCSKQDSKAHFARQDAIYVFKRTGGFLLTILLYVIIPLVCFRFLVATQLFNLNFLAWWLVIQCSIAMMFAILLALCPHIQNFSSFVGRKIKAQ